MNTDKWYCPAIEKEIEHGVCWEYCFATIGGPSDTAYELYTWIKETGKFQDINEFHRICENCAHCQWSKD